MNEASKLLNKLLERGKIDGNKLASVVLLGFGQHFSFNQRILDHRFDHHVGVFKTGVIQRLKCWPKPSSTCGTTPSWPPIPPPFPSVSWHRRCNVHHVGVFKTGVIQRWLNGRNHAGQLIAVNFAALQQLAVLGAGIMGGGISYQSAWKGVPVKMKDINPQALT
jgi:hypothetical protein